ncbi:hypothetical protein MPSEU_000382000 [Mayamaea pseudoterrestris]|nr:hypothetical protein MPSEU_000382000 [Mayamaea pseudoterrestris]
MPDKSLDESSNNHKPIQPKMELPQLRSLKVAEAMSSNGSSSSSSDSSCSSDRRDSSVACTEQPSDESVSLVASDVSSDDDSQDFHVSSFEKCASSHCEMTMTMKKGSRMRLSAESSSKYTSKSSTLNNEAGRRPVWYFLFLLCLLALAHDLFNLYNKSADDDATTASSTHHSSDCIYVPGGGFSGFWFTLGRLQSIPKHERLDHEYYCYSAGCLAVIASAVLDKNMEQMYDMAHNVQKQWQNGTIDRYSVVRTFLDDLLNVAAAEVNTSGVQNTSATNERLELTSALSKIHIITTTQHGWMGAKTEIRTATNFGDLHEMLLQTTWIPFAVGNGLWHKQHMDGAFTALRHPTCQRSMGLAMHPWLLANVVNVNLPRSGVEAFWNLGLNYGLA